ncbi:MAG TPA: tartrate dehydrogenase [Anaerolineaceae bacterium]|nr:tartrate dehydrogenase [Anaerolineaceae bacterium]
MGNHYRIAVLPGDGIGKEVMPEGLRTLRMGEKKTASFHMTFDFYPWGSDTFLDTGRMMPEDALKILKEYDSIYFGAVGLPEKIPDHITLWKFILPIRQGFDQYINLRPIRLLPGLRGSLRDKGPADIDFVVIRENTEGEYSGAGGRVHIHSDQEVAVQTNIFTRTGTERVLRYGFELARKRRKKLISATKSNACQFSMVFWDEVYDQIKSVYPEILAEKCHIDALAARFVTHPETLDVVVASNLFGDILSDLGGALQGSLGLAPSANLNPEKKFPSLFEPVHGSAPDIAGKMIANPIAMIWAGSLMLDFLGESEAATLVMRGIDTTVLQGKVLTPDLGGKASTTQVGQVISEQIEQF